jgi:hypothetical protein
MGNWAFLFKISFLQNYHFIKFIHFAMTNYMLKTTAVLVIFCLSVACLPAQTTVENLQNAVQEYNAMREYMNGFNAKTVNDDHLSAVKNRMNKGLPMLEKVLKDGTPEQIKTAQYFKSNFKYQYSFVLGMMGKNAQAYDVLKEIERDITSLTGSDFPLRYEYFGKNFIINWDNFSATQAEYLTSMGEVAYNLSRFEDAIKFTRMALNHSSTTNWLKYIAVNKMLDIYNKKTSLLSDAEYHDFALKSMKQYDALVDENKQTVKDNNYPTTLRGADIILNKAGQNPSAANIQLCAEAAPLAAKYEKSQANALKLFELCYRNNYNERDEFHRVAVSLAKIFVSSDKDRALYVGTTALDKIAAGLTATNCEAMSGLAADYRAFGNNTKAATMSDRHRRCVAEQEAERLRQEELRRKQEEADRKRQHRYEHPFNIYIGLNVFPLLTKPEKMDFGGHIDFRGRRVAHSFGYSIINQKNDLHSSSEDWDGFRAFYAMKIFSKSLSSQFAYSGFYLGYSEKDFQPILAQISSHTDPNDFTTATLIPHDKQYDLLWNNGVQFLGKGFGMDLWAGIGASYYQLSYDDYDVGQYAFTGHDFFESRGKKDSFSIHVRLGMSIGLNMGRKRD